MRTFLHLLLPLALALSGLSTDPARGAPAPPARVGTDGSSAESRRSLFLEQLEVRPADEVLQEEVRRLLGLHVGKTLSPADLSDARERLLQSGWFEDVEVYAQPGSTRGAVRLQVELELDRGVRFESGFGHEPLDGWVLDLAGMRIRHLGRAGSSLGLTYQTGLRRRDVALDFELPRALGSLDLLFEARGGERDWNVFSKDVFLQQRIEQSRTGVGLRGRWGAHWRSSIRWSHRRFDPTSLERRDDSQDPVPFALLPGDLPESESDELGWGLVYDRRAPRRSYREGFYGAARAQVGWLRSGPRYGGLEAELRGNLPIAATSGLSLRIAGRMADSATPYFLRPTFGGQSSVRGYRDASLSGAFGARATLSASAELLTPLLDRESAEPRLLGVLFVDAGNFADADGQWADGVLGVGWGLRLRLPWIDHIGLDAGYPMSPAGTSDPFWVHFGLGVGF